MPSTPIRIIIGIVGGAFVGAACWQAWLTTTPLGWLAIPAGAVVCAVAAAFVKEDYWNNNAS